MILCLEDPGEVTTTDQDVWLVSHASCGAGKFNNLKRQQTLGFDCVSCDRTAFLNNYNAPYGVKATNVDGKDTLRREQTMDNYKGVVHGKCCVNPHHSVCAEMIKEYKSKCELSLVMDSNGNIVDEVSKGTGVQCLDSGDDAGDYDCVMGPNNAVCQNGGTPQGKMVSGGGCSCSCPTGFSGDNCQVDDNAAPPGCAHNNIIDTTCECEGSTRTAGSGYCATNEFHEYCVSGAYLSSMSGDTCACWDGSSSTATIAYKNNPDAMPLLHVPMVTSHKHLKIIFYKYTILYNKHVNPITSMITYCFTGKRRKIRYSNVLSEFEDIHGERVLEGISIKKMLQW